MRTNNALIIVLISSVMLIAFIGCGGVNSRIKKNEHLFASYPPETQGLIQNEKIEAGFTEDMVRMAKGDPSDVSQITRKIAQGKERKITLWKYRKPVPATHSTSPAAGSAMSSPYGYPGFGPGPSQPIPMDYTRIGLIVEFEQGKVIHWTENPN